MLGRAFWACLNAGHLSPAAYWPQPAGILVFNHARTIPFAAVRRSRGHGFARRAGPGGAECHAQARAADARRRALGQAAGQAAACAQGRSCQPSRSPVQGAEGRARRGDRQGDRGPHLGDVDGIAERHRHSADAAGARGDRGQGPQARGQAAQRHHQDQAELRRSLEPARQPSITRSGSTAAPSPTSARCSSASRAISARGRASA